MSLGFEVRALPWVPPGRGSEEVALVQNFLDHERGQLARFVDWRRELVRIPPGGTFERQLTVLLKPADLPLSQQRLLGAVDAFIGAPISGRAVETEILLFPHDGSPPLDRPVTIETLRRAILPPKRGGLIGEKALVVESWTPAGLREFLPPLIGSREAEDRFRALLDEFPDARSVVEGAARAFAGSPAHAGSGAGLDSTMGAPGVSASTAAKAGGALVGLLPPWESSRLNAKGPRLWAGDARRYPGFSAYRMVLDSLRPGRLGLGHPAGLDQSSLFTGAVAGSSLLELLIGGDDPVLRTRSEVEALASAHPRQEAVAPAVSLFVWAHGIDVTDSAPGESATATERAVAEIASGLGTLLVEAGMSSRQVSHLLEVSPVVRQGLRRAALARARVQLRNYLEPADFKAIAGSFSDSVAAISREGRPADLRPYLVEADAALSAQERDRRAALQLDLLSHPGSTPEETWDRVSARGLWDDLRELEGYLDVLATRGNILVERGRFLSWLA